MPASSDGSERRRAEHVAYGFAQAMAAGDIDAASSYFATRGCFLTPDRTEVCGRGGIHSLLAQLAGSEVRLKILVGKVVTAGDVALATQQWKRSGNGGSEPFRESTVAHLVLVREPAGWSILIAAPWG